MGAILAALLIAASGAIAGDVPLESQAEILVRALAYDAGLLARAGGGFTVGVLYDAKAPSAAAEARKSLAAFQRLKGVTVQGLPLEAVLVPYEGEQHLLEKIQLLGIDTLYLQPELDGQLAAVLRATRVAKAVTMASLETQVGRGASIGVFSNGGRSQLRINLAASKAEGALFKAALLQIALIVR